MKRLRRQFTSLKTGLQSFLEDHLPHAIRGRAGHLRHLPAGQFVVKCQQDISQIEVDHSWRHRWGYSLFFKGRT